MILSLSLGVAVFAIGAAGAAVLMFYFIATLRIPQHDDGNLQRRLSAGKCATNRIFSVAQVAIWQQCLRLVQCQYVRSWQIEPTCINDRFCNRMIELH